MAFWKKSNDPWDRKPEKKPAVAAPAPKPPAWAQVKQPPEPMNCPWCGKEMLPGNLYGSTSRGAPQSLTWREGSHKSWLERIGAPEQEQYLQLGCYEEAWYCMDCQKMVLDVGLALKQQRPNYEWKNGKPVLPEETEE